MLINDKLLSPYQIVVDHTSCTIIQPTNTKDKNGNIVNKVHGYYGAVEDALYKVAKMKIIDSCDSITIKDYISEFRSIKNELLTLIDRD